MVLRKMLKAIPFARRLYWFARHRARAEGLTFWKPLVPGDALEHCVRNCLVRLLKLERADELGDYLEFGVSRGTSLACVGRVIEEMGLEHVRLIGFDSFEGLPAEAAKEGWTPGQYHSTIRATRRFLKREQVNLEKVVLVKGWFRDTLNEETRKRHQINKASVIMIDCDIYSASKEALLFSEPHIQQNAIILFDDWGWRSDRGQIGQREAFEEFLEQYPSIKASPLPSYLQQARVFMIKRSSPATVTPSVRSPGHHFGPAS